MGHTTVSTIEVSSVNLSKQVFIKALQIKTRRKFELRLSTSVHLLENLKQSNLTFSKTCAF